MFLHLNEDFRTKSQMESLFLAMVGCVCARAGLQEVDVWCVKFV